jgi:uncharacterized membrane protein
MTSTFRVSFPVLLSVVCGAVLLSARPASAQLRLCNKSSETVSMALAYHEDGNFVSRGWFVAQPGECATVVSGALHNRYYYVRAEGSSGGRWNGDHTFCVADVRFTHNGDGNCTAAGMDARTFFEIDTGLSSSWTQGLTMGGGDSQQREHDAIAGLRVSWRESLLDDGTYVMQLHNGSSTGADVTLQCFTRSGRSKTLSIQVPGYGMSEVGFLQGWDGNFVAGESCEAYHGREFVWRINVPR